MNARSKYFLSLVGTGYLLLIGTVTGILTARVLGPEGRGILNQIGMLPILFMRLGNMGLPQSALYLWTKGYDKRQLGRKIIFYSGVAAVIECALLALLVGFGIPESTKNYLVASIAMIALIPLTFISDCFLHFTLAAGDYRRFNYLQAVPVSIYLIALVFAIYIEYATVSGFAIASMASWIITLLFRLVMASPDDQSTPITNLGQAPILRTALSIFSVDVSLVVLQRLDLLIVGFLGSAALGGQYVAANTIAVSSAAVGAPLARAMFQITASSDGDTPAQLGFGLRHFRLLQPIVLVLTSGLIAMMSFVITLTFGPDYWPAVQSARILALAFSVSQLSQILDSLLKASGLASIATWSNLAAVACLTVSGVGAVVLAPGSLLIAMSTAVALSWLVGLVFKISILCARGHACLSDFACRPKEMWSLYQQLLRLSKAALPRL
jgi:O-antigen/teichoic acid export membrane protein